MAESVELSYRDKRYIVDFDPLGQITRIRVAYQRVHGQQQLGVLRAIFPSARRPSDVTVAVIEEATATWQATKNMRKTA